MSETQKEPISNNLKQHVLRTGLIGGVINGCAILLILGLAIGLGIWLDSTYSDSGKRLFTFGLVAGSVPVTLVVIFFISRRFSARMTPPQKTQDSKQEQFLEDVDSGNN